MFKNLRFSSNFFSFKKVASQPRHRVGRSLIAFLLLMPMLLFSHSAVQAADGEPTLSIPASTINVMADSTFELPVNFADAAEPNDISAMSFSLDFDQDCLTFDNITDADANGIPDAVTNLPVGYVSTVSYDAADTGGEIDLSISDQSGAQDALPDVRLVTFEFGVKSSCRTADADQTDGNMATVSFTFDTDTAPTFGNLLGNAVLGGTHAQGDRTLRFNATPTNISLTSNTVNENVTLATTVGTLSSTDFDIGQTPGDSHTYSLVTGTGDTNNTSFTIVGAALKTNTALDFETKSSYSILVRTTDSYGGTFDKAFTINVADVNETPTSLTINTSSVDENSTSGTTIGTFSSADLDAADASANKNYSFTSGGVGALDNASFSISGRLLKTSAALNYELKKIYNVHVLVTDIGGLSFDNIFTIRVNDVNDAPVAFNDTIGAALEVVSAPKTISVLANDTDEDTILAHTLKVVPASVDSLTAGSGTAVANNSDTSVLYTPAAGFNGPVSFSYLINDGAADSVASANVALQVVANDARGDCNADTKVNAGDFPAFVLELADTDTAGGWYNTYTGSYHGSPMGCDANADKAVNISDLTCAVLVSFGSTACTIPSVQAANTLADAELTVGQNLVGVRNSTVNVPVRLTTNGQSVAAASFALSFDKDQLAFDATDADQNGLPDAVTFNTPRGMVTVANYNEAAGRLELTVYAVTLPMPMLTDGLVANVALKVNAQTNMAETPITLVQSSLGSDQGQAVPVQMNDGSVQIAQNYSLFLPIMLR
ncbi:MAG: cadherin domain-containing protein [Chloroflexi bacterium]|nr:cadherin domain-containing protein [Chloroflexota bacterium]